LTHRKPYTESPSSVKVPVLSNTKVVIRPERFTLGGEMQKIRCFLRRKMANATPQLIAAGRAGGTQMTIKFRKRSIKVVDEIPREMNEFRRQINPSTAMQAIRSTNLIASAWNLKLICLGYKMSLTRLPLVVRKPVFVTRAVTGWSPTGLI